jgi:hypothetical protein
LAIVSQLRIDEYNTRLPALILFRSLNIHAFSTLFLPPRNCTLIAPPHYWLVVWLCRFVYVLSIAAAARTETYLELNSSCLSKMHPQSIRKMCFGKKPKSESASAPAIFSISAPTSQPFDYEKNPLPPWQATFLETHTIDHENIPDPKVYHTKYPPPQFPQHFPVAESDWSGVRTRCGSDASSTSTVEEPKKHKWFASTRRLFRNRGLDENGNLKNDYQDIVDDDWGTPDAYTSKSNQPKWPSNY